MKRSDKPEKRIPEFRTDEEAADFVENANLMEYDLSGFRLARFEFQKKEARVNMRMPQALLQAVKREAARRGMPYQRYIREVLERAVKDSAA